MLGSTHLRSLRPNGRLHPHLRQDPHLQSQSIAWHQELYLGDRHQGPSRGQHLHRWIQRDVHSQRLEAEAEHPHLEQPATRQEDCPLTLQQQVQYQILQGEGSMGKTTCTRGGCDQFEQAPNLQGWRKNYAALSSPNRHLHLDLPGHHLAPKNRISPRGLKLAAFHEHHHHFVHSTREELHRASNLRNTHNMASISFSVNHCTLSLPLLQPGQIFLLHPLPFKVQDHFLESRRRHRHHLDGAVHLHRPGTDARRTMNWLMLPQLWPQHFPLCKRRSADNHQPQL